MYYGYLLFFFLVIAIVIPSYYWADSTDTIASKSFYYIKNSIRTVLILKAEIFMKTFLYLYVSV